MSDTGKTGLPPDANTLPQADVLGTPEEQFTQAASAAMQAGQRIARDFRTLGQGQRRRIASMFRRQLVLPRKPGRKRSDRITAAHADWKAGMRGIELYRKHIRGFETHSFWRRKSESRSLMDAIRARERRDKKRKKHADLKGAV